MKVTHNSDMWKKGGISSEETYRMPHYDITTCNGAKAEPKTLPHKDEVGHQEL